MGNCVGGFRRRTIRIAPWKKNKTIVICFLGADGAGKTTIVKALQGEDLGNALPTVGFSRAEFTLKKYKIVSYDLGGANRIRGIWGTYFAEVYGIVYVVDSAAASRIAENQELVALLRDHADLMHKPILFLLNKKDLPAAMDELHFSELFHLHDMARANKTDIRVEGICAVKGTGKEIDGVIHDSLEWLVERIVANYAVIDRDVAAALKALRKRQAQDRLERQHRLAEMNAYKSDEPSSEKNLQSSAEIPIDEATHPSTSQLRNGAIAVAAAPAPEVPSAAAAAAPAKASVPAAASNISVLPAAAAAKPSQKASTSSNVPLKSPQSPTQPIQSDAAVGATAVSPNTAYETSLEQSDEFAKSSLRIDGDQRYEMMDQTAANSESVSSNADNNSMTGSITAQETPQMMTNNWELRTAGNPSSLSPTNLSYETAAATAAATAASTAASYPSSFSHTNSSYKTAAAESTATAAATAALRERESPAGGKASTSSSPQADDAGSQSAAEHHHSMHSLPAATIKSRENDNSNHHHRHTKVFVSARAPRDATLPHPQPNARYRKRLNSVEIAPIARTTATSAAATAAAAKIYSRKKSMPQISVKARLPPPPAVERTTAAAAAAARRTATRSATVTASHSHSRSSSRSNRRQI